MKESAGIMSQPDKKVSQRLFPIGVNLVSFAIFAAVAIILRASVAPVRIFVKFVLKLTDKVNAYKSRFKSFLF